MPLSSAASIFEGSFVSGRFDDSIKLYRLVNGGDSREAREALGGRGLRREKDEGVGGVLLADGVRLSRCAEDGRGVWRGFECEAGLGQPWSARMLSGEANTGAVEDSSRDSSSGGNSRRR